MGQTNAKNKGGSDGAKGEKGENNASPQKILCDSRRGGRKDSLLVGRSSWPAKSLALASRIGRK